MVQRGKWQGQRGHILKDLESSFAYPMFVKPANLGSSVGISKVSDREELAAGLDLAARYDERLLVEPGIVAREIEIAILGNRDPQASVPGEIRPRRAFLRLQGKVLRRFHRVDRSGGAGRLVNPGASVVGGAVV